MKKYVFLILSLFIIVSCPAPFHDYVFVKNGKTEKEYTIELDEISISFSGKYKWSGENSIYTAIGVGVNNKSAGIITVDRKNMIINSKDFHFKNNTTNKITISPMSQDVVMLEYEAFFFHSSSIPKNAIFFLKSNGIEINGKSIKVEQISFIPEENVQVATE
jgi:uncharacterized protein YcfL